MEMLGHGAGIEKLPKARGLAARIAQRMNRRLVFEIEKRRGSKGGSKGSAGRRVVPDAVVSGTDRHADPRCRLEAVQDSGQQGPAAMAVLFGKGEGGRHDHAAGMNHGFPVQVVRFQDVAEAAQQEGHAARIRHGVGSISAIPLRQDAARLRIAAGNAVCQRIEGKERCRLQIRAGYGLCPRDMYEVAGERGR